MASLGFRELYRVLKGESFFFSFFLFVHGTSLELELQTRGRGVDGRVRPVFVPAQASLAGPGRWRLDRTESAAPAAPVQTVPLVHEDHRLRSSQKVFSFHLKKE